MVKLPSKHLCSYTQISAVLNLDQKREWSIVNVKTHSWSSAENTCLWEFGPKRCLLSSSLQGSGNIAEVGGGGLRVIGWLCLLGMTWTLCACTHSAVVTHTRTCQQDHSTFWQTVWGYRRKWRVPEGVGMCWGVPRVWKGEVGYIWKTVFKCIKHHVKNSISFYKDDTS